MKMKKHISLLLALVMIAMLLAGCGTQPADNTAQPSSTNAQTTDTPNSQTNDDTETSNHIEVLRIGGTYKNDRFTAWSSPGLMGQTNYHSFVQLNLWRVDANGELTGDGCFFKKWDISEDNTSLVLQFDPLGKLMFHDDTPVTMEDVLFTINYYKDRNSAPFQSITSIEEDSDTSIKLTFSKPIAFGFMHSALLNYRILAKHIWEDVETPSAYNEPDAAIGCGPYKLVSIDEDAQISYYEAVKDYPIGTQTIDRVELKSYDSHAAILMALQNDEVDVLYCYSAPVDTTLLPTFESNTNIDRGESMDKATYQLIFGFETYPTNDINFRKAVSYALDYNLISQTISGEHGGAASTGAASPAQLGYINTLPKNAQDTAKAIEYLDNGGYIDVDGDGFRELPDGSPMNVSILIYHFPPDNVPKYKRLAEIMQITLAEIGVRVTPDEQSMAGNSDYILDTIRNNRYDMWIGSTTFLTATWGGIANYVGDIQDLSGQYFGTCKDPVYLEAYTRLLTSTNYDDYKKAFADLQVLNAEMTTAIVLDETKAFYPYRNDKIIGWENYPGVGVINTDTWYNAVMK